MAAKRRRYQSLFSLAQDQVTHDTYGLGRVIRVEDDTAVVVDFGTQQVRIATPCVKLNKL